MIQIDKSEILPEIRRYSESHHRNFTDNVMGLADETIDSAQEFFDSAPWEADAIELFDTPREMRASLGAWVKSRVKVDDIDKAWFVPSFVWVWIAGRVMTWIVKLIIDRYWPDIVAGLNIND
jgi:hypothetical protein